MNKAILIHITNYIPTKIMNFLFEQYRINNFVFLPSEIKNNIENKLSIEVNPYFEYDEKIIENIKQISDKIEEFLNKEIEENCVIVLEKNIFMLNKNIYDKIKKIQKEKNIKNIQIIEDLN